MSSNRTGIPNQAAARIPSELVRVVAARVRVNSDKQVGRVTPNWIIELARKPDTTRLEN